MYIVLNVMVSALYLPYLFSFRIHFFLPFVHSSYFFFYLRFYLLSSKQHAQSRAYVFAYYIHKGVDKHRKAFPFNLHFVFICVPSHYVWAFWSIGLTGGQLKFQTIRSYRYFFLKLLMAGPISFFWTAKAQLLISKLLFDITNIWFSKPHLPSNKDYTNINVHDNVSAETREIAPRQYLHLRKMAKKLHRFTAYSIILFHAQWDTWYGARNSIALNLCVCVCVCVLFLRKHVGSTIMWWR